MPFDDNPQCTADAASLPQFAQGLTIWTTSVITMISMRKRPRGSDRADPESPGTRSDSMRVRTGLVHAARCGTHIELPSLTPPPPHVPHVQVPPTSRSTTKPAVDM